MKRLAIIGAGDLGQQIAEYAENDNHYTVVGFFDDFSKKGESVREWPILGSGKDISTQYEAGVFDYIIVAIAYKHFKERKAYFDQFKGNIPFGKIIHSSSYVHPQAQIGDGSVLFPGCVLDRNVVIANNVLLHIGCHIIGGCHISSHSFLSGGVGLAGFATIGECCFLGVNVTIIDNIRVGDNIKVGGGAVVIKTITEEGWYVGNPARFLRPL